MQESDTLKVTLQIKEKELLVLEEKLSARESVSFLNPLAVLNVPNNHIVFNGTF